MSSAIPFVLDNILEPLISSFFIVIGGAIPVAALIYLFSREEKKRLQAHAKEINSYLPMQEVMLKKMAELIENSLNFDNVDKFTKQYIDAWNIVEDNKKFTKYAESYSFITAIGHVLRMGNYLPKGISEHKEIAKNLPSTPI